MTGEGAGTQMDQKVMKALLDAFDRSDWQEMTITIGSDRLHVSRQATTDGAAPPAPAAAPAPAVAAGVQPSPSAEPADATPAARAEPADAAAPPAAAPAEPPASGTVVESPSIGLFWRAPSPGAPPFVEVGATVADGDTVAIVEVMKLMNHVHAPVGGVVTAVLVENGATVEYGQALIVIDPGG